MLTDQIAHESPGSSAVSGAGPAAPAAPLTAQLRAVPGVQGVAVVRAVPGLTIPGTFNGLSGNAFGQSSPVPAAWSRARSSRSSPPWAACPAGATAVAFPAGAFGPNGLLGLTGTAGVTWPAASVPASRLDALGVDAIAVGTDGTTAAVEQARTLLVNAHAYPVLNAPSTIGDIVRRDNSKNSGYQQLANVVILVSLPIAGCTLVTGIAAGPRGPQAAVQPAAADRRPARHAAPRRRA